MKIFLFQWYLDDIVNNSNLIGTYKFFWLRAESLEL